MKVFPRHSAVPAALIVITAVVIVVLASIQYRWSVEVRESTGVRMADTLQLSMINWHLDFFRNLSEVCLRMRIDPATADGEHTPYVRRFAEWRTIARYPDLVSGIYVIQTSRGRDPVVLHLARLADRFEPAAWPLNLGRVRETLEGPQSAMPASAVEEAQPSDLAEAFYSVGAALRGWRFDPEIPALVSPIPRGTSPSLLSSDPDAMEWLVIELDTTVLQTRLLPDLAHRYFQGTDGLDYQVAVVAGAVPRRVIYSSDAGFGRDDIDDADGRMDVFRRVGDGSAEAAIYVFHEPSQSRRSAAALGISWFPLLRDAPEDEHWQLVVRHRRGGPLGAFITAVHRRNLAISFGALLLLAISMAILIIVSNRAHRLAGLQMDFVTAVSHELRTPLAIISSAADNVAHGVVEGKDQLRQYGTVIGNQARQLSGLVEQVLLFAATRDGHQRYSLQSLTVPEIVDATLAATQGLIQAAHFTVEREIEPQLPPVTGDLVALCQCLQNLITNALKYGREARWIRIRACLVEDGATGREIQVSVADAGPGIPPADVPHIFDPFYRSPAAAAAQIHGTGLGLTLAKRIAEAMKGQLTVTSEPGRGSTFTLHLPCAEPGALGLDAEPNAPLHA